MEISLSFYLVVGRVIVFIAIDVFIWSFRSLIRSLIRSLVLVVGVIV